MNDSVSCQFREAVPTVEDYCQLRVLAGLSAKSKEAAARALPNTLYGVCAYQGNELVAMGRIVGDGGCHLQVCDIAVLPRLQGRGLGKEVMRRLDGWMRAVHDPDGNLLAFTLSVPEPVASYAGSRWELALDHAGHGLWDWDLPSDAVIRSRRWDDQPVPAEEVTRGDVTAALLAPVHPDDQVAVRAALDAHLRGDGEVYTAQMSAAW